MGNKNKLLNFIIPEIVRHSNKNDIICELMAGTNCVSYALKDKRKIYTNDIQYYSYVISNALIKNNKYTINSDSAISDLKEKFDLNIKEHFLISLKQIILIHIFLLINVLKLIQLDMQLIQLKN